MHWVDNRPVPRRLGVILAAGIRARDPGVVAPPSRDHRPFRVAAGVGSGSGVTLWFMRALEQDDGQWVCRFAHQDFGTFPDLDSALWQLTAAALALGGRELFRFYVHHRDGRIEERLGTDPVLGE